MSHILSQLFRHSINSQSCQRGVLLGLLLYLISPVVAHSGVVATAKGQAEQKELALNTIYLPFISRDATLTVLTSMPALTPVATAPLTDTFPSSSILPTITATPSTPLAETLTPTAVPTLIETLTAPPTLTPALTPTPILTPTLTGIAVTIVPTTPVVTLTPTAISTTVTTPAPTATSVNTLLPTAIATANTPMPTPSNTAAPTATPTGGNATLVYTSSNRDGIVGGIAFKDEDILSYNMATGVWTMVFDGSDVGIAGDVEALHVESDGTLLLSLESAATIPGFGVVEDEDIVRFIPTSLGDATTGSFAWFFDGSDVGLDTDDEDIDALTRLPDGRLVISTADAFDAGGVSGLNQDLFIFTASSWGETTSGAWAIYFDGSDMGMTNTNEDIWGVEVAANGDVYLSTNYTYAVPGLSGDSDDIFICTPASLGDNTSCTFSLYWDGDNYGFGSYWLDVLAVSDVTLVDGVKAGRMTVETEAPGNQIYLPIINR